MEGRLHLGVERDIAESDIVHLGLPPSLNDYNALLLSEHSSIRRRPAGLESPLTFFRHRQ